MTSRKTSLKSAVETVLSERKRRAMTTKQLFEAITERQLHSSIGRTPQATLSALLSTNDRFERVAPGECKLAAKRRPERASENAMRLADEAEAKGRRREGVACHREVTGGRWPGSGAVWRVHFFSANLPLPTTLNSSCV